MAVLLHTTQALAVISFRMARRCFFSSAVIAAAAGAGDGDVAGAVMGPMSKKHLNVVERCCYCYKVEDEGTKLLSCSCCDGQMKYCSKCHRSSHRKNWASHKRGCNSMALPCTEIKKVQKCETDLASETECTYLFAYPVLLQLHHI